MKEQNTPQMECLQRIRDISIHYDGNANHDCSQGDMKGLCRLIDEMRSYAETGLRGEWPDFIENEDTYWMIERKSLDGNAEWYCAGHDRWTKDANKFPIIVVDVDILRRIARIDFNARVTRRLASRCGRDG